MIFNLDKDVEAVKNVQYERLIWAKHNFPNEIPQDPTLGIVEEYGEYIDAMAIGKRSDIKDALADMAIFTIAVANYYRIYAADELATVVNGHGSMRPIESRIGALCHAVLKHQQNIRNNESHILAIKLNIGLILEWIRFKAHGLRFDFGEMLTEVWRKVKARDWTKEKPNGIAEMAMAGGDNDVDGETDAENGMPAVQHGAGA